MPPKRKSSEGVIGAVKRFKTAARGRQRSTAVPPATPSSLSKSEMETLTKKVSDVVSSRLESKMEEMIQRALSTNQPPQPAQMATLVDAEVSQLAATISGTEEHAKVSNSNNTDSCSQEVLATTSLIKTTHKLSTQSNFVSSSLKPGENISDKLKAEIRAGKYVDFRQLVNDDDQKFKLKFNRNGEDNELSLIEEKNKKSLSLQQWLMAWNKFTAIFCTKNPELGSDFPHHLDIVLEMSREGGNWQFYDSEFRKLVEKGEAQWGNTHLELFLKAKLQGKQTQYNFSSKTNNARWPWGVCFPFHRGLGCKFGDNCRFQHRCFNCGFHHAFSNCKKPVSTPFKFVSDNTANRKSGNFNQPFRGDNKHSPSTPRDTNIQNSTVTKNATKKQ